MQAAGAAAAAAPPRELSAKDIEAMLHELLAAYTADPFQKELAALRETCSRSGTNPLLVMGPVVLKVQAPILERYGQPPSAQGVDLMKHAVERRVAEGNELIESLANKARLALGLAAMPNRTATAEQVLAAKVDETNARLGLAAASDAEAVEGELRRQCHLKMAADASSGALPAASAAHLTAMLDGGKVPVPSILALAKMAKLGIPVAGLRGDGVPASVAILESPSPADFFKAHVLPNRPAVLRGTLDSAGFPPLRDFPDADFLRRRCGQRRVLVKSLSHRDQEGRPVFVSDPELKLPLTAFLDKLEEHESTGSQQPFYLGKVPLRKELPELAEDIERASLCPQRLYGSCFGDLVPGGVFTYFGCGRNTTPVHWDAHENLLLCVCGTKRLLLYPPSDARFVYPCNDFSRSAILPFARFQDYSPALRGKFALVSEARPLEVNLGAGDLLYLPSSWWHCVEGSDDRNMILNWWFALHPDKRALAFAGDAGRQALGAAAAA